jgi:hypothetical protein
MIYQYDNGELALGADNIFRPSDNTVGLAAQALDAIGSNPDSNLPDGAIGATHLPDTTVDAIEAGPDLSQEVQALNTVTMGNGSTFFQDTPENASARVTTIDPDRTTQAEGPATQTPKCPPLKRRPTKRENALIRAALLKDINENGLRHPLEYARDYGRSPAWVSKNIALAVCSGELLDMGKCSYEARILSDFKQWQRELLGLGENSGDPLIRVEHGDSCFMVSVIE